MFIPKNTSSAPTLCLYMTSYSGVSLLSFFWIGSSDTSFSCQMAFLVSCFDYFCYYYPFYLFFYLNSSAYYSAVNWGGLSPGFTSILENGWVVSFWSFPFTVPGFSTDPLVAFITSYSSSASSPMINSLRAITCYMLNLSSIF